jgi:hypothetical protein
MVAQFGQAMKTGSRRGCVGSQCGVVGTLTRRSASRRKIGRFSLLGVLGLFALVATGCFGGSPGAASSNPPPLAFKPNGTPPVKLIGKLVLDITHRQSAGAAALRTRHYHIACNNQGDASVTIVCSGLALRSSEYYGLPVSYTMPRGGMGSLLIRGTIDGSVVRLKYRLGQAPQYPNRMRLLPSPSGATYLGGSASAQGS